MKPVFSFIVLMAFLSCKEGKNATIAHASPTSDNIKDTVIIKHKNELNKAYEAGFLSKSYSYNWVVEDDTLDFELIATEYEKDSSLHLYIMHRQPILFTTALKRIGDCLKIIGDDFYVSNLSSLYLKPPIYYADLSGELSRQYEQTFGQKNVSYQRLTQFLLETDFDSRLNIFLKPLGKTVSRYGIEKFHLLHKENYSHYLIDADLTRYPDFTIHGMGLTIQLTTDK